MVNEQISLSNSSQLNSSELEYLERIVPDMRESVMEHGASPDLLVYNAVLGYTVVSFCNFTAFRLRLRGKQHSISVPLLFSDLIPDDAPTKQVASEDKYIRILLDDEHSIDLYTSLLCKIVGATVDRYPKEWDCCSRYMACSDAGRCIHPDKAFAMQCGYRKILSGGKVFYGINRNI